jgi:hypothetical protein
MKIVLFLLALLPATLAGQEVTVRKIVRLTDAKAGEFVISAISPDGSGILASTPGFTGLVLINPDTKSISHITNDQGAGYMPAFSDDGKKIFYRSDDLSGLKKYSSLYEFNLENQKTSEVTPAKRDVSPPIVNQNHLLWSESGVSRSRQIDSSKAAGDTGEPYLITEDLKPVIYSRGNRTTITPNGPGYYIWTSLSPDKTKILYNFGGTGTYVSDITGNILYSAGRLNTPKWLNDDIIIGMNDTDDGQRVTASEIVCHSIASGEKSVLTNTIDIHEMNPFPFPDGKRVAFNTTDGTLFVMHIHIK